MEKLWIRIVGNPQNIDENRGYYWRAFLNKKGPKIPLTSWKFIGNPTDENLIPGNAPEEDTNGLTAWIDVYGSYTIKENILTITL